MTPMETPLRVHPWPDEATDALTVLQSEAAFVVISVVTAPTENRTQARESIRRALRELLAAYWQQPAETILFSTVRARELTVLSPACSGGLSISHAPGCSVAAVHRSCAVGVDVMRVDANLTDRANASAEWEQLAHDYLGPAAHQQLLHTVPAMRATAFAQAWCQFEAALKCRGQGLTEWTPALGQALGSCKVTALDLPDSLRGALATGTIARERPVVPK